MSEALLEKVNNPTGSYPYICAMSRNLNFISHYHESIEIIYVKSGTISAFCGAKEVVLKKGDVCIFMPGEIHGFQSAEANHLYVIKLDICSYTEEIDLDKLRLADNRIKEGDNAYPMIAALINEMVSEHLEKKRGYEFAVRCCKNKIVAEILRNLKYDFIDTSRNIRILSKINKFLEERYGQKVELEEIAAACHFSKYYFAHKLKEMTGMTFVQYLTAFRLEKAAMLLKNGDMTITEVAAESGFGSLRSFNRAFLSAYKITPSNFRKSK